MAKRMTRRQSAIIWLHPMRECLRYILRIGVLHRWPTALDAIGRRQLGVAPRRLGNRWISSALIERLFPADRHVGIVRAA